MTERTITYNRAELYAQVWAAPVRQVARRYGVSDVALAKVWPYTLDSNSRTRVLGKARRRPCSTAAGASPDSRGHAGGVGACAPNEAANTVACRAIGANVGRADRGGRAFG